MTVAGGVSLEAGVEVFAAEAAVDVGVVPVVFEPDAELCGALAAVLLGGAAEDGGELALADDAADDDDAAGR